MLAIIEPSVIKGNIKAPASKSSMQRACAAALLSKGTTLIKNPGHSSDDKAALDVIKGLGAAVEALDDGGQHRVHFSSIGHERGWFSDNNCRLQV